jgi:hypothetical protein
MQFQPTPMQMRTMNRSSPESTMSINAEPSTKEIPYDYVARFTLQGKRANRVPDVINISVEGAFVAVAIGYSFIPKLSDPPPLPEILVQPDVGAPTTTTLFRLIAQRITTALKIPDGTNQQQTVNQLESVIQPVADLRSLLQCLQVKLCGIHFKYSIVDSGSGRELQNQPIHNIAGLGESSGERPFRPLAKPMVFMPRSTIRLEIEEISEGPIYAGAELYIVLHGYKILGYGTGLP